MTNNIHKLSDVEASVVIDNSTRVWQFVVILKGAKIGKNCNICAHTLIEGDVIIGDNVTVKSGVYLWDGSRVEDNVLLGPNVTFTNDLYPKSKNKSYECLGITIKKGASVGAGAVLLAGITIGEGALIGAGAVVTKDVPAGAVVTGNPAKVTRYLEA